MLAKLATQSLRVLLFTVYVPIERLFSITRKILDEINSIQYTYTPCTYIELACCALQFNNTSLQY